MNTKGITVSWKIVLPTHLPIMVLSQSTLRPDTYQVDTCSSSFRMIQAWPESFSQLNVKASTLSEVCLLSVDCYMHSYEMSCMHMCSLLNIDSYWLYNYTAIEPLSLIWHTFWQEFCIIMRLLDYQGGFIVNNGNS